jgi:transposase
MFFPESRVRVWLYARAIDMRKSFTGLSALAKNALGEEPTSGDLFVFINRRRTYMKVLYFDRGGYCLWCKRLEQGQFHYPRHDGDKIALDVTGLKLLLEGIEARDGRRYRRYEHRSAPPHPV